MNLFLTLTACCIAYYYFRRFERWLTERRLNSSRQVGIDLESYRPRLRVVCVEVEIEPKKETSAT